jgi:hypothetical protein
VSDSTQSLRAEFESAGWREESPRPEGSEPRFDGIFSGGFATCAVVLASSSVEVAKTWPDYQGILAQLKVDGSIARDKDLYLFFVVDSVDQPSLGGLQRALDDTRVCRKVCPERRGRSLRDTLNDIPFFSTPGTETKGGESSLEQAKLMEGLPEDVQRDLERKSAKRILASLIAGEYEGR